MSVQLGPVMIDIAGPTLSAEDRELLRHPGVGGLIFFARNYRDRAQLQALIGAIRRERPGILLAVDQEGGRVQRFVEPFTRLPSMQLLAQHADAQQLRDVGWLLAAELLAVGMDFSFAPVLDVDDHFCRAVGDRSFAARPDRVAERVGHFIAGMREAGMATTGKHFPGHGQVAADSHVELPRDRRPLERVLATDCVPFSRCIAAGLLDAVMPAHIHFAAVDQYPVGFSRVWLQDILRQQLGFDGVIFSDDLTMEGAGIAGGYGARILAALKAGCDMGLVCNHRPGALQALQALEAHPLDPASSRRLQRMRGRQKITSWEQLQRSERWQRTRAWLASWM